MQENSSRSDEALEWPELVNRQPFFRARISGGAPAVQGQVDVFVGHRLGDGPTSDETDGIFASWHWNGRELIARTDRYGFFPVYYHATENEISISTSLSKLIELGAPCSIDEPAMSVFVRFGQFLGEDTPFKHIKALPPNATFAWARNSIDVRGGYHVPAPQNMSLREAIDAFIDLFRESIRSRAPRGETFAIPLTGGRDSRHILLALLEQGFEPTVCLTAEPYPPKSLEDLRIAKMACDALQLNHQIVRPTMNRTQAELEKNERTSFCSFEHIFAPALYPHLAAYDCIYDGIAGDILSAGLYLTKKKHEALVSADVKRAAASLFRLREGLPHLRRDFAARLSYEKALHRLEAELTRHLRAANPVASFYFWNRTRRNVALVPFGLFSHATRVYAPYLDHALYDFVASLGPELFWDHRFHELVIDRAYPQTAGLPYENKNAEWRRSRAHYFATGLTLLKKLMTLRGETFLDRRFCYARASSMTFNPFFSPEGDWWFRLVTYFVALEEALG